MSSLQDAITDATGQATEAFDAVEPEVDPGAAGSILRTLRTRAHQLQAETTVDLDIPGYNGVLVGRYRAISIARVFNGPGGTLRNPITEWGVAADALGTALQELYGRSPDTGDLEPLFHDQPARFDDDLVMALDLPAPAAKTARAVLVALLGGGNLGESRVWQHYLEYQAWLTQGSAAEVADDAVGER